MSLPPIRISTPIMTRDKTRSMRARLAEISLKMHTRSESERVSEPSTSLRMTERF